MYNTILQLFYISIFILLIVFRKKFTFPDKPLSNKAKVIFALVAFLIVSYNGYNLAIAYYKAYNPDYEYDKIANKVGFHIYKPAFIPGESVQTTKFYLANQPLAGKNNVVMSAYDLPMEKLINQTPGANKNSPIVIRQAKMDPGFDLKQFVDSLNAKEPKVKTRTNKVTLSNWPSQPAFMREKPFGNRNFVDLEILTTDNILITLTTLGEQPENIIKMAESLQ